MVHFLDDAKRKKHVLPMSNACTVSSQINVLVLSYRVYGIKNTFNLCIVELAKNHLSAIKDEF